MFETLRKEEDTMQTTKNQLDKKSNINSCGFQGLHKFYQQYWVLQP
jgi:hypothetical protein